ncbi:glycoside hydrolase family 127 protein [Streptomyces deccanensis]|nr:beta-L-arabinofuranosidase domain-containing protein [Streptomyces deccanensis]ULR55876.1 glycoside hydrolase family 127 protein [Streptomyces deccanensis]
MRWPERGLVVEQTSTYPAEGVRTLVFREGGGRLDLRLRVPSWATAGFTVTVNGVRQPVEAVPGSYLSLSREWRRGDRVGISAPYRLRVERTPDDPMVQSVFFGPLLLVAQSAEAGFRGFSFYEDFTLRGDLADAVRPEGRPLHFTTHGLTLAPFFAGNDLRYHAYFRRSEPVVVFGTAGSGVPNRSRGDGLTFLDVLWARAPFATSEAFVGRCVPSPTAGWPRDGSPAPSGTRSSPRPSGPVFGADRARRVDVYGARWVHGSAPIASSSSAPPTP